MQQDVAELVRQRPDGGGTVRSGADPDTPGGPHRGAVGRGAVLALDGEASRRASQHRRPTAVRLPRRGRDRRADSDRAAGCLRQVPDPRDPGRLPPVRRGAAGVLVALGGSAGGCGAGGGEDLGAGFRLPTWRPIDCHARYPRTMVAPGCCAAMSTMFAKLSPGSRAASRRHLAQSSGVRTAWACSPSRARSTARLAWRSCSRAGTASAIAGFQAADGCQPAEPVVGDAVSLAAELFRQRCLAQAATVVPGLGDDAGGCGDELTAAVVIPAR